MNIEFLEKIKSILDEKRISYVVKDESIIIPYILETEKETINIAFFKNGNAIVGMTFVKINSDFQSKAYEFCSTFNKLRVFPKLYSDINNNPPCFICESSYDLDIFPYDFLEKWIFMTVKLLLTSVKEINEMVLIKEQAPNQRAEKT